MTLQEFFSTYKKVALGFSGGVDSAYLLYEAKRNNVDIRAYYVKTQFQPEFELRDAIKLGKEIGVDINTINYDILSEINIANNPSNRCYFCKNKIFSLISERAASEGYNTIIDGTNLSDSEDDRPGMKALKELNILSPLRICGLTKDEIRRLSKEAGLFTWNKAAYACLATRVAAGNKITEEILNKIEKSENFLYDMGYRDFRVRYFYNAAKLQFKKEDMDRAYNNRFEISNKLKTYFNDILLDLEGR